jgi:hypothetical protein
MMRIHIRPSDLNVADMTITWSSNPVLGICQNATTAASCSSLQQNAIIHSCGLLVELYSRYTFRPEGR